MCNITEKLKKIVEKIPDNTIFTLDDLKEISKGVTNYKLDDGKVAISKGIYTHEKISIALTQIPDKGRLPFHVHKPPVKAEVIFVLSGILRMTINNKEKELLPETVEVIKADVKHDATAIGDVLLVAITIPKDEAFPK